MADKSFRNLPPEDRIKKLKELEEKKKKEIEEAEKMIRESVDELKEQKKWEEKVPIPEVATEDVETLGEEGRVLIKAHKNLARKEKMAEESAPAEPKKSLEETLAGETGQRPAEAQMEYGFPTAEPGRAVSANQEYILQLSQEPAQRLKQQMADIYNSLAERGSISGEEARRV